MNEVFGPWKALRLLANLPPSVCECFISVTLMLCLMRPMPLHLYSYTNWRSVAEKSRLVFPKVAEDSRIADGLQWRLIWSDEFNTPDGTRPDPKAWTYDLGGNGWGNHELESYTSRPENAKIIGGNLVISARQEQYTGGDGLTQPYTSARLKTQGLFANAYGRFEARIKIPRGQGIWPAFWMMGDDVGRVDWPDCGEIDVMENIGREPGMVYGSLHAPSFVAPTSDASKGAPLPNGQNYSDDFHIYAAEWEPGVVRFYVDSNNYATFTESEWPKGGRWVFDHPFFLILNVAVGGDWPKNPDATSQFPQQMLIDYVRVYRK